MLLIFSGMFGESYDMKDIHSRVGLLLTFVPAVIVLYFINDPFWGLIVSQMLLSVQLPLTVFMQIWLTSSPKVMGTYANKPFTKGLLYAVGFIVTALKFVSFYMLVCNKIMMRYELKRFSLAEPLLIINLSAFYCSAAPAW